MKARANEPCTECSQPADGKHIVIVKRGQQIVRETFCGEQCRQNAEQQRKGKASG